jgi:hypothetical protein
VLPGNHFGKGPKFARMEQERRKKLQEWTTDEDAKTVWLSIMADAKTGDPVARRLFADYIWGRATQPLEIATPGLEEFDRNGFMRVLRDFLDRRYPGAADEFAAELLQSNGAPALEGPAMETT